MSVTRGRCIDFLVHCFVSQTVQTDKPLSGRAAPQGFSLSLSPPGGTASLSGPDSACRDHHPQGSCTVTSLGPWEGRPSTVPVLCSRSVCPRGPVRRDECQDGLKPPSALKIAFCLSVCLSLSPSLPPSLLLPLSNGANSANFRKIFLRLVSGWVRVRAWGDSFKSTLF